MILMAVDPAITAGAIVIYDDDKIKLLLAKSFKHKGKQTQEKRLSFLYDLANENCNDVDHIIAEKQFVDIMSQSYGAVAAAAGKNNLTITKFAPKQWMKILTGSGKCTKQDTENYIKENYNYLYEQIPELERNEHVFDACGMLLAYIKQQGLE